MSWREYLASLQEVKNYQAQVKKTSERNKKMYFQGPQDAGSAYPNKTKGRSQSSPVGFGGALEEEVDPASFESKDQLQPEIWRDKKLNPEVARKLKQIAQDFLEALEKNVSMDDLRFTGSLANYNWSEYSDIDLHIVVDFSRIDDKEDLVKSYFDAERMKWNNAHDIKLFGFEVEIYVENKGEPHVSSGLYSILRGHWIEEPDPHPDDIQYFHLARKKADSIATQTNLAGTLLRTKEYRKAFKATERLKKKIRVMRDVGLAAKKREYSMENIAFKILRRDGTLQLLNQIKDAAYDKMMSINGA